MHVAQVNLAYDPRLHEPEALLDRYDTLVGWSEALLEAGAARVTVLQRFGGDADVERDGVRYLFRKDGGPGRARAWTRVPRLRHDLAAQTPDLVHVNGLMFPLQTWALRRALRRETALVVQDHGGFGPADVRVPAWVWRTSHAGVDAFLFSAAPQADEWRAAHLIAPGAPIVAIPESSRPQPALSREEARRRAALPGDPAVLWVGRLNANKDPLTVLDAFAQTRARLPRAALTLVFTEGDLRDAVNARIAATPALAASVHLRGPVPAEEMPALFAAADLFVLGSRREGSGYALLEALAAGAVPVVTDIPSFRAFTADGTIGALWPPGDAAACAAALVAMGTGEIETRRRAAARHFEEALSWRAVGRRALAAYRDLLARRRGAR